MLVLRLSEKEKLKNRELYELAIEKKLSKETAEIFFNLERPSTKTCLDIWSKSVENGNTEIGEVARVQASLSAKWESDWILIAIALAIYLKEIK